MSDDQRGILCVICGMLFFSMQDVLVKGLADSAALTQIIVVRGFIGAIVLLLILRVAGRWLYIGSASPWLSVLRAKGIRTVTIHFRSAYPWLAVLRSVLFYFGFMSFYFALGVMPIAEATSLFFASPLFITIFSRVFLKNPVGWYRYGAICLGFLGMVLIVKPNPSTFNWVALLPIFCALAYSIAIMIARYTRDKDSAIQQTCHIYMGSVSLGLLSAVVIGLASAGGGLAEVGGVAESGLADVGAIAGGVADAGGVSSAYLTRGWVFDDWRIWLAMVAIAGFGTGGLLLLIVGYRLGNPATVAPFEYTMLIMAVIAGVVFFDELPDVLSLGGMGLIIGSGVFIFIREGIRKTPAVATKTLLRG